jgi:hypothetical protein
MPKRIAPGRYQCASGSGGLAAPAILCDKDLVQMHSDSTGRITSTGERNMEIVGIPLSPLVALIAGVLILVMPRLLNYIVAIYLIIVGLLGIFPQLAG